MKTIKLKKLSACREAVKWVKTQKSPTEAWQNCERGDWMLWLAKRIKVDDKKLTMAKAMCAKQVSHLMKDQRSKDALQACFDYVNGKITRKELNTAAYAAAAVYAADDTAADTAADAAAADAADADAADDTAADAPAAAAAAYAADATAAYAADAADAVTAYAAAYAADVADAAADTAAAYADTYADAYADAYITARRTSLKKSADICREYLTKEILLKYKQLK